MSGRKVHVMVDIESLSTSADAVVLSIGAVAFAGVVGAPRVPKFNVALHVQQQINAGREISASTLQWWMKQSDDARSLFTARAGAVVQPTLRNFNDWLCSLMAPETDELIVWANGVAFDIAALTSLYATFNTDVPWKYNAVRDARTLYKLFDPGRVHEPPFKGTQHDALADAEHQAGWVLNIAGLLLEHGIDILE